MIMPERATLEEVKDFCNRVREAGGGEEIKDLLPARPGMSNSCLIAKNLNFGCAVQPVEIQQGTCGASLYWPSGAQKWGMHVEDPKLAQKIATAMDLPLMDSVVEYLHGRVRTATAIILPEGISAVASAYDSWWEDFGYGMLTSHELQMWRESEFYALVEEDLRAQVEE